MAGPLDGVLVLDLTRNVAGPYCTQILGDMGAEVWKIEEPGKGDELRWIVTFRGRRPVDEDNFYQYNRNKKGITINLKNERGQELVRALAKKADIFLQNYSPGTMEKFRLDYGSLRQLNPRLIYCSTSGFGTNSPYKERKAFDPIIQAMGGTMSATGPKGGPPMRPSVPIGDLSASVYAALAIAAALYAREHTGRGQFIDIALLDCAIAFLTSDARQFLANGEVPRPFGNEYPGRVPMNTYLASDGAWVYLYANPASWPTLCQALGIEELIDDPRFNTNDARVHNREELNHIIAEKIKIREGEYWEEYLSDKGVPCAVVKDLADVFSDPHTKVREMLLTVEHPVSGTIKLVGWPYKFSDTPASLRLPPPLLGQHTGEILTQALGYTREQLEELQRQGVV